MSAILGAAIGAGANLIGNWFANQSNANLNEENMMHQREMLALQQNWASQQAKLADERQRQIYLDLYSPEARRQQLEDAGLSVGMMYGAGGAQGQGGTGGNMAASPGLEARTSFPQKTLLDANVADIIAKAAKTEAETKNIEQDTKNKQTQGEQISAQIDEIRKNIEKTTQDIEESKARIENYQHDNKLKEAATAYNWAMEKIQSINAETQGQINWANLAVLEKEFAKLDEEGKKLGIENDILQKTKQSLIKKTVQEAILAEAEAEAKKYENKNILPQQIELIKQQVEYWKQLAKQLELSNNVEKDLQEALDRLGTGKAGGKLLKTLIELVISVLKVPGVMPNMPK